MNRIAVAVVLLVSGSALATDVTTCGQKIAPGDTGILQADLDCSAADGFLAVVFLGDGATLLLNGHTIVGRPDTAGVVSDVASRCAIVGPGVITGASTAVMGGKTRFTLQDVSLTGNRDSIDVPLGLLTVTNVTANSTGSGIRARDIRASSLSVDVNGAGDCVLGQRIRGTDVTVSGCYTGVGMQKTVRVTRLDCRNNVTTGVSARKAELVDSIVTGNIFIGKPLDILSRHRPRLVNTTCGTSAQWLPDMTIGLPWGVCTND